ncbi:MAG: effector binding domain-containing protein [Alphaproteobacteria bacterium]|nr:effector binding domain-containing protein [Alphaproteobacteria bacterium]
MTAIPTKQDYEIRAGLAEVKAFDVVGISIVTDNSRATDDINALWERFFSESIGQQIPGKTDDTIYAVYSDYQGDHEAPYRLTIGYRVPSSKEDSTFKKDHSPAPLPFSDANYVKCKAGEYAVMSAAGKQPKALLETWEAIWSSDLSRAYQTDFEVYGPRFFEDGVNEVLIHVGVKR